MRFNQHRYEKFETFLLIEKEVFRGNNQNKDLVGVLLTISKKNISSKELPGGMVT